VLQASHIKPWRDSTNQERLDPMNGLLLQPTLDHLFDLGLISFDETGAVLFSPQLSQDDIEKLELAGNLKLRKVPNRLEGYMEHHRNHVFRSGPCTHQKSGNLKSFEIFFDFRGSQAFFL
jgi:putative restriction endonuclease